MVNKLYGKTMLTLTLKDNAYNWNESQSLHYAMKRNKKACLNYSKDMDKKRLIYIMELTRNHQWIFSLYKGDNYLYSPYSWIQSIFLYLSLS